MKIDDLDPDRYWRTSAFDYEVALILQNTLHEGREAGMRDREKDEARRRDLERREQESLAGLMERMG